MFTGTLTLTSQTGFNKECLYSTEDYNRFNTASGLLSNVLGLVGHDGEYCDPQLGCSEQCWWEKTFLRNTHSNFRRNCDCPRI